MQYNSPLCPNCQQPIAAGDINPETDVAFCRQCNVVHKLSVVADIRTKTQPVDLSRPPAGVKLQDNGVDLRIEVSHRSVATALGTLGVAIFWNGIVSIFVAVAIAGTLHNFDIAQPSWLPTPEVGKIKMGLGMTLFLWLFLLPFIMAGWTFISMFLMAMFGKTEISIERHGCTLFTGLGHLGVRKRFEASDVLDVQLDRKPWSDKRGNIHYKHEIVVSLRAGKPIRFGSGLSEPRCQFITALLRKAVLRP